MTFWGFPAESGHDAQRFPKGSPGNPAGCAGLANTSCIDAPTSAAISVHPLTDNPPICTGEPLTTTLEVQTYQDPEHLSEAGIQLPADRQDVKERPSNRSSTPARPPTETDAPSGLNVELSDPQPLGFAATPSEIKSAIVTLPPGFTINPDAADGQSDCTDAAGQLRLRGSGRMPRQRQDRHLLDRLAESQRAPRRFRLYRRTEARTTSTASS